MGIRNELTIDELNHASGGVDIGIGISKNIDGKGTNSISWVDPKDAGYWSMDTRGDVRWHHY
jgi:hypothetical protein